MIIAIKALAFFNMAWQKGEQRMDKDVLLRNNRRTVLIVEDEAVNREMLGLIVESSYNVIYAEDGVEALDILRERFSIISMVLLDINMPRMNGIELLKIIREDENLRRIPVIVLTSDKSSELETLRIGALDFITKPYDMPEIIMARVNRIIEFAEDKRIIQNVERDSLTDLYTKNFFFEYGLILGKNPAMKYDILVLDLDHFRIVNEMYGKSFGDRVIKAVAKGIKSLGSGSDCIACRSRADTFYVMCVHSDDYEGTYQKLTKELSKFESRYDMRIRLRMGIYKNVDLAQHNMEWYVDAAKSASDTIRSIFLQNYIEYDDRMYKRELYQERLVSDMEQAMREKQFKVYFQPKYNIKGDEPRLSSAEALIRWVHPEFGFISPGEFIPLFEKNGLILKLDDYVMRETSAKVSAWKRRFGHVPPVSVNLSRMDFTDPRLTERLLDTVKESGLEVKDIMLEVLESAFSQDDNRMIKIINDFRRAGFFIEMDDFGSGYSSLNMLCVMPIDALKIDMKFVENIINAENGFHMVELVVEMAKSLSVPAIVEGVESDEQYNLVKNAGCDVVQGYYFSKPIDEKSYEALLEKELAKK